MRWCRSAALIALLLAPVGCCSSGARARAARYAEINRAHERDGSLPRQAREVAQDNADAWAVQAWELGGPRPSAEILARVGGAR